MDSIRNNRYQQRQPSSSSTNKPEDHIRHLCDPWLNFIAKKGKGIYARPYAHDVRGLKKGDYITFVNESSNIIRVITVKITDIEHFISFEEYLHAVISDSKCSYLTNSYKDLDSIKSVEEGIVLYREFYSKEDEQTYGVVAIKVCVVEDHSRYPDNSNNS